MRTFAYLRVSTEEQDNDNQLHEISKKYAIEPRRVFRDEISGKTPILKREGFTALLSKLEQGDVIVVNRVDRLGRSASDVLAAVEHLQKLGIGLIVLQLESTDITSPAGKLLFTMLLSFAELEKSLISERTKSALAKKKAEGVKLGRPAALSANQKKELQLLSQNEGFTVSAAAKQYSVSRASVLRALGKI